MPEQREKNREKERIIITLGKGIFEKLTAESAKKGLTKSVIIQLALEEYFNFREEEKA